MYDVVKWVVLYGIGVVEYVVSEVYDMFIYFG